MSSSAVNSSQIIPSFYMSGNAITTTPVTLSANQSGQVVRIGALGGASQINLPPAAPGLNYKFVCTATLANAMTIRTDSGATIMYGTAIGLSTGIATIVAHLSVVLGATCVTGDWCEVYSDGTNWYVKAQSAINGAITSPA